MEDIDGGLHPAVDGQSLDEDEDEDKEVCMWTGWGGGGGGGGDQVRRAVVVLDGLCLSILINFNCFYFILSTAVLFYSGQSVEKLQQSFQCKRMKESSFDIHFHIGVTDA